MARTRARRIVNCTAAPGQEKGGRGREYDPTNSLTHISWMGRGSEGIETLKTLRTWKESGWLGCLVRGSWLISERPDEVQKFEL